MKFTHLFDDANVLSKYVYHCNAQYPAGEMAFGQMQIPFGWAKIPLVERVHQMDPYVPVSVIYGKKTWMDSDAFLKTMHKIPSKVEVVFIPKAGHHVYIDNQSMFNEAILKNESLNQLDGVDYYTNKQ